MLDTVDKASGCREETAARFLMETPLRGTAGDRGTQKQQSNMKRGKSQVTQRNLINMTSARWSRSTPALMIRCP